VEVCAERAESITFTGDRAPCSTSRFTEGSK
jgi:hypothetical protein